VHGQVALVRLGQSEEKCKHSDEKEIDVEKLEIWLETNFRNNFDIFKYCDCQQLRDALESMPDWRIYNYGVNSKGAVSTGVFCARFRNYFRECANVEIGNVA
jgi:hypothetical protein